MNVLAPGTGSGLVSAEGISSSKHHLAASTTTGKGPVIQRKSEIHGCTDGTIVHEPLDLLLDLGSCNNQRADMEPSMSMSQLWPPTGCIPLPVTRVCSSWWQWT